MTTGAAHSSSEICVRLAGAVDTEALVRLINEAFAVEKVVIEGERIDSEKVRALFVTGNFLQLYEGEQLLGCLRGSEGHAGLSWFARGEARAAEIRIWTAPHEGRRRFFASSRLRRR